MGSKPVHPLDSGNENHTHPRLASRLTIHPDECEECTVYPADVTPETQLTWWASAFDGSFIGLDAMEQASG